LPFLLLLGVACGRERSQTQTQAQWLSLLNVSYDPTREFYAEFNTRFAAHWQKENGGSVEIKQSHGGSGKQARAVIDGLEADVVTLALEHDVATLAEKGLVAADWKTRLPSNSAPYTSVIVLVVRKGNPKQIHDWEDLARPGVEVITPNPKTGGGARLNYLAAWAHALSKSGRDEAKARDLVGRIYHNVTVLDSGARGSANTFVERGIGDVWITWESEAIIALEVGGAGKFEVVTPSTTILAEPSVAVVDSFAKKHGTTEVAKAYLEYLFSPEGQELIAKHHFRPRDKAILEQHRAEFRQVSSSTVDDLGGWSVVQPKHFADNGVYDQLMLEPKPAP
jgi:sulfate transport system substrate-binding protein